MLINLLAESQGLPEAFRILSLFEHPFGMLWEPENVRMMQKSPLLLDYEKKTTKVQLKDSYEGEDEEDLPPKLQALVVSWDDAQIADYFYKYLLFHHTIYDEPYCYRCYKKQYKLEYSLEINPPTEAPIKSIYYYPDQSWKCGNEEAMETSSELEEALLSAKSLLENGTNPAKKVNNGPNLASSTRKYCLTFDGLEPGQSYSLTFSTEIDGLTIMQNIRSFECEEI